MLRLASLLTASVLLVPAARGDDPLPTGEQVLEKFVEASGGRAALLKVKNRSFKGKFELPAQGIKGTTSGFKAEPDKEKFDIEIPGLGHVASGHDGTTVWESTTTSGPRIVDGEEKQDRLLDAVFHQEADWKKVYSKADCVGVEDVAGKPAFKVVAERKVGKPVTLFFDKSSGLVVKAVSKKKVQGADEVEVQTFFSDYKKVGDVLMPFVQTEKLAALTIVETYTEVKENVELPPDAFQPPAEIRDLIGRPAADKPKAKAEEPKEKPPGA